MPAASPGRSPGVLLGLAGTLLIGMGACSAGFSFNPDGWGVGVIRLLAEAIDRSTGNLLVGLGVIVLCVGWWLIRPRPGVGIAPGTWLVWSAPLLVIPPVMSGDPFLYADLGWILANGANPYEYPLASFGGPYAPFVDAFWAGHGVAYPPLSLWVNWLAAQATGMHPYWGVIAQRVPAVAAVAVIAVLLPRLADRLGIDRGWATWLGVLNPILIIHFVGGAHNDALMAAVVVFALWLSLQRLPWVSPSLVLAPVLIGLAMGLKQQAGLAVLVTAGLPVLAELRALPYLQRLVVLGWRSALSAVIALGVFAGTSLASGLGFGWTHWLGEPGRARTLTLSNLIGDLFLWTGEDLAATAPRWIALLALAGLASLLFLRPEEPLLVVAWGSLLVLFVGPALHPWYVVLSLLLIALLPLRTTAARWVVFGGIGYLLAYTTQSLFALSVLHSTIVGATLGVAAWALHRAAPPDGTTSLGACASRSQVVRG